MFDTHTVEIEWAGRPLKLETGKIARQADGAVLATYGETVVLATVVSAKAPKPGQDFFPLTVNYQEKTYAAGKIPGGYFKREGRPSENETLVSRLIDRPIRPLFPEGYKNDTQVVVTVVQHDLENNPDVLSMVAASAALTSAEPVVRAGLRAAARSTAADASRMPDDVATRLTGFLTSAPEGRAPRGPITGQRGQSRSARPSSPRHSIRPDGSQRSRRRPVLTGLGALLLIVGGLWGITTLDGLLESRSTGDLGAAPGGWSQYVRQALGDGGRVVALDILEMPPLAGVEFLHGDFREETVLSALETLLDGQPVDLVLSDMAPNMSGVDAVDLPRAMHLAELAMDFADRHLRVGGTFLIKLFQGVGFDDYVRDLRRRYAKVVIRKPAASRKRSPEVYALGQGKKPQPR